MSYVKCAIIGTSPGGEVWSINPTFDPSGEFPDVVSQSNLDAAASAIGNVVVPGTLIQCLSTAFAVSAVRLEVRADSDDRLIALSQAGYVASAAGTGAPKMPGQAAIVFSLRTDTPGPSGRGRVYWPAPGVTISTALRMSAPTTAATLTDFKTYMTNIRNALATNFPLVGFNLAVRSKLTKTTPHVVRIQLGDVIDTQRRRRDALVESYQTVAFP